MATLNALLLAAVVVASASAWTTCQPGWYPLESTSSCYKPLPGELGWTIAEFRCLFQGAHLASITSYEENSFVQGLVYNREMFTGAAFFGNSAYYVNSDGKPFRFKNWETGYQLPMNTARRCVKMNRYGEWFPSCCKIPARAVCKKPALVTTTTTTTTPRPTTTYGLDPAWTRSYKHKYYWRAPVNYNYGW